MYSDDPFEDLYLPAVRPMRGQRPMRQRFNRRQPYGGYGGKPGANRPIIDVFPPDQQASPNSGKPAYDRPIIDRFGRRPAY